jgi:DNA repair exonuclease SbcCD ATPase subunit
LSQQLPQLVGGFGPLGAAIGAVVAVGAALAPTLLNIGDNAETAGNKTRTYGQSLEAVNEIVKEANDASKTRAERLRDEGDAALEGARKELEAAQAKLEALRAGEATGFGRDILQFFGVDPEGKSEAINPRQQRAREQALDRLGERAQTASERFNELKARLDQATESLNNNSDAANDNAETAQERIEQLAREADTNMRLADALQVSEERYEEVQRRIEAENIARELGISIKDEEFDRIQQLVRAREREAERLQEAREKMRDVDDATNDATDSMRDLGLQTKTTEQILIGATEDAGRSIQGALAA